MSKQKNEHDDARAGTWTLYEPRGVTFTNLLTAGLTHADRACLITPEFDDPSAGYVAVRAQLTRFLVSPPRLTRSWPGSPKSATSRVSTYKFCAPFIDQLVANSSGWFDWQLPHRPEDLSLLRGQTEWLVSVTHEQLIYLQTEDRVLKELLDRVPGLRIKSGPGFRGGREK